MKHYKNIYADRMDREIASFIKETRKNSSWRALATIVSERYPNLEILSGNQLEGMELCQAAREFLKEKDWD
jgi:hypothetical protein